MCNASETDIEVRGAGAGQGADWEAAGVEIDGDDAGEGIARGGAGKGVGGPHVALIRDRGEVFQELSKADWEAGGAIRGGEEAAGADAGPGDGA